MEIKIPIIDDNVFEPDENFFIRLHHEEGATLGDIAVTEVTIIDDDTPGIFSLSQPAYTCQETEAICEVTILRENGIGIRYIIM